MNDIISIISLLSIYIFGLAVIAYTFADTGRTANQRKYEKKLKEAILYGEFKNIFLLYNYMRCKILLSDGEENIDWQV